MYHIAKSTRFGTADTVGSWFNQNHRHSNGLNRRGHKAIATANVEEWPGGGEPAEQGQKAGVAVGKPERAIFECETGVITFRRVGDRLRAAPAPDTVRVELQAIREICEIKRRAACVQTAGRC
jgi:hypothetical protein